MKHGFRWATLLASVMLVVGACSGGGTDTPSAGTAATASAEGPSASPATPTSEGASPSAAAGAPVTIRWFCCLGTGQDPSQVKVENQAVADFNASHPNIKLQFEVVDVTAARDTLATEIAGGNSPDIVGPVGVGGAEAFHGQWLDLAPLIQKNNVDVSQFSSGSVDFYISEEGQPALPFAIYPSFTWFQKEMFDEAGLNYPPQKYGDQYKMPDGSMVDWSYDTIAKIAPLLTVDNAGRDATQAGFDPKHIIQYGFDAQRDDARGWGAYFGAGSLAASDGKTVSIPPQWLAAWRWFYDGIWHTQFDLTDATANSQEFNGGGYPFCSGKVAMQVNFLWSKYCLVPEPGKKAPAGENWDIAAAPSYNGKVTAGFNADTFRILKKSKNPDAAFTALTWLLTDGSKPLLDVYGGMPARTQDQADFFAGLDKQFPQKPDWQVAIDSVQYADNPNFEAYIPAYNQTLDRVNNFWTKLRTTAGLDLDKEIAKLTTDLQAIWDRAK